MPTYPHFDLEVDSKIATVTINRPEKSNAFTLDMWQNLGKLFNDISESRDYRVVILRGAGKNFCAGMDLSAFAEIPPLVSDSDPDKHVAKLRKLIRGLQGGITAIENCAVPVIAAVQKACIGGGINIVAACDMRYGTTDSYFSIKEVDLGIVCDLGALQRMPKFMNYSKVAEMAYTGRRVNGTEAESMGLIAKSYEQYDEMMSEVRALAATIAAKPPSIIRGIKKSMLQARATSVNDGLQSIANYNSKHLFSDDLAEAMRATMTKTKPEFKD